MTKNEAYEIVFTKIGRNFSVKYLYDTNKAYVFIGKAKNREWIPDTQIVAVNKQSGKMGFSGFSDQDAINHC